MSYTLIIEQMLNGVQFGVMLFLMAAGLTLVFGIMNLINLAHGSLFMAGAYLDGGVRPPHRQFLSRGGAGDSPHRPARRRDGARHPAPVLWSLPSRSGAGDVRPDPGDQRDHPHDLGAGAGAAAAARLPRRLGASSARRDLSDLPPRDPRGRRVRGAVPLSTSSCIRAPACGCGRAPATAPMASALGVDVQLVFSMVFAVGAGARRSRRHHGGADLRRAGRAWASRS